jgi:hypothetical protein
VPEVEVPGLPIDIAAPTTSLVVGDIPQTITPVGSVRLSAYDAAAAPTLFGTDVAAETSNPRPAFIKPRTLFVDQEHAYLGVPTEQAHNLGSVGPVPQTVLNKLYNSMLEQADDMQSYAMPGQAALMRLGAAAMNGAGCVWASWSALWNKDANGGFEVGVNPFSGESKWGTEAWDGRFNSVAQVVTGVVGAAEGGLDSAAMWARGLLSKGAVAEDGSQIAERLASGMGASEGAGPTDAIDLAPVNVSGNVPVSEGIPPNTQFLSAKYKISIASDGRRVYKNVTDIDPGAPKLVSSSVNKSIRQKISDGWTNLDLMENGYAPIGPDGMQMNLHHVLGQETGPMVELQTSTHQAFSSQLHGLIEEGSSFRNDPLLNRQYNVFRSAWWTSRAGDFY